MTIEYDNVFYFDNINSIGGVETFFYYLSKKFKNIVVFYDTADYNQIKRLSQNIEVHRYKNQKIKCKNFIVNYSLQIINNVEAEEYIQVIHADYKALGRMPNVHPKITKYIGVSKLACDSFTELTGLPCELIYNYVEIDKPRRLLKLISGTRLTPEKGRERMELLGKALDKANIPYIWLVFTDSDNYIDNPNIIYKKPTLDITSYIAEADYLVQLSSNEGFCFSAVESLILSIPVIMTDLPVLKEIGVIDRVNGFVLDLDMNNIPVKEIYKGLPKFKYEPPKSNWSKYLKGKSKYNPYEQVKVYSKKTFDDIEDGRHHIPDEVYYTTRWRADYLKDIGIVLEVE